MPHILDELAELWELELSAASPRSPLARVVGACTRGGAEVVLKLASPSARFAETILALRAWNGSGAPRLLGCDEQRRALLLERVRPGTHAVDATAAEAARLLETLGIEPPPGLPRLEEVVRRRIDEAESDGRVSPQRVAWARKALERLEPDGRRPVLIHGAFDERNVLRCDRRNLCAIDPSPCAGERAYDAASWIHARGRAGRRARFEALASELELDRSRLRDWCGVIAVHG